MNEVWPKGAPKVGQRAERSRMVDAMDIELFTRISGDRNPLHYDEKLAKSTRFGGIVVQGIAFGAAHGYQGWKFMLLIAVYGSMFGLLAHGRRSLRPGMITHFVQDGLGGLLARHFLG